MFLAVKFRDIDGDYIEHINITHITRTSFVNRMNPDAGTYIHLRTGEVLSTFAPMDLVQTKIDECFNASSALILFNIFAEKAKYMQSESEEDANEPL